MTSRLTTHEMIALARPNETLRRVQLVPKAVMSLSRTNQNIRVLAGIAWITVDRQDFVLHPGQKINLSPGKYESLISPLGDSTLIFEIETLN